MEIGKKIGVEEGSVDRLVSDSSCDDLDFDSPLGHCFNKEIF